MPNASRVTINDEDKSIQVADILLGISGISGVFRRGPINDPNQVFNSQEEVMRVYGAPLNSQDAMTQVLRVLARGGKVRINGIRHYADPTDPSTLAAIRSTPSGVVDDGAAGLLFTPTAKYKGDYNDLKIVIKVPSNGLTAQGFFDMDIYLENDKARTFENWVNLKIENVNVSDARYLDAPINESRLVNFAYNDLSAKTVAQVPAKKTITFTTGTFGAAVVPADYIGSAAGATGFYAFDAYEDIDQIAVPVIYDGAVNLGGAVYADNRKDLMFFAHLNQDLKSDSAIIAQRALITLDSRYYAVFHGGVKFFNVLTNREEEISEMGDILGVAAYVDKNFGPWMSLANKNRGFIPGATGVVTNFGAAGNYAKRDALAQRQINAMVAKSGVVYLSGNYTGRFTESKASYLNVARMLIWLRKTLQPILEKYLEEPTDIRTFVSIYNEVQPTFESLKNEKRAIYDYEWNGDQDIDNIDNVVVNNLVDLDRGKYKVKLRIEPITGLAGIDVAIILEKTGAISIDAE
jgi:hypothetical protein